MVRTGQKQQQSAADKLARFQHSQNGAAGHVRAPSSSPQRSSQDARDGSSDGSGEMEREREVDPCEATVRRCLNFPPKPSEISAPSNGDLPAESPELQAPGEPTLGQVMEAIMDCKTSLATRIESVHVDLSLLKNDMQGLRERVTETESRINTLEDTVHPLTRNSTILQRELAACKAKLEDLENRSRRNNLRFIGFPEKSEGTHPELFLQNWLQEVLTEFIPSSSFSIERAHRTPPQPPPPGASPRPLIAKIQNFQDKVAVLRTARLAADIRFNGNRISIFPDFSAEVQRQRASFLAVKKRLRDEGLSYAMLYPAKLRVTSDGKSHFFISPSEASDWMDGKGLPQRRRKRNERR